LRQNDKDERDKISENSCILNSRLGIE
jgi:hypothetical protein